MRICQQCIGFFIFLNLRTKSQDNAIYRFYCATFAALLLLNFNLWQLHRILFTACFQVQMTSNHFENYIWYDFYKNILRVLHKGHNVHDVPLACSTFFYKLPFGVVNSGHPFHTWHTYIKAYNSLSLGFLSCFCTPLMLFFLFCLA